MPVSPAELLAEAAAEGSETKAVFLVGEDGSFGERLYHTGWFGEPCLYRRVNFGQGHRLYPLKGAREEGGRYILAHGRADLPDIDPDDGPAVVALLEYPIPKGVPPVRLDVHEARAVLAAASADPDTILTADAAVAYDADAFTLGGESLAGRRFTLCDGRLAAEGMDNGRPVRTEVRFASVGGRFDPAAALHAYRRAISAGGAALAVADALLAAPEAMLAARMVWKGSPDDWFMVHPVREGDAVTALESVQGDRLVDFRDPSVRFEVSRRGLTMHTEVPSGEPYDIEVNVFLPAPGRRSPLYAALSRHE